LKSPWPRQLETLGIPLTVSYCARFSLPVSRIYELDLFLQVQSLCASLKTRLREYTPQAISRTLQVSHTTVAVQVSRATLCKCPAPQPTGKESETLVRARHPLLASDGLRSFSMFLARTLLSYSQPPEPDAYEVCHRASASGWGRMCATQHEEIAAASDGSWLDRTHAHKHMCTPAILH